MVKERSFNYVWILLDTSYDLMHIPHSILRRCWNHRVVVVVLVAVAILGRQTDGDIICLSLSAALSPKFEGTLARKNELGKLKGFTP